MPKTYNPDCDFCSSCGRQGHESEDCVPELRGEVLPDAVNGRDKMNEVDKSRVPRTAWMIERRSMGSIVWFCAGTDRWTKDSNKAIQFPDKSSAKEVWTRLFGKDEDTEVPYEDGRSEWIDTYDITEHCWLDAES